MPVFYRKNIFCTKSLKQIFKALFKGMFCIFIKKSDDSSVYYSCTAV